MLETTRPHTHNQFQLADHRKYTKVEFEVKIKCHKHFYAKHRNRTGKVSITTAGDVYEAETSTCVRVCTVTQNRCPHVLCDRCN